MSSRPFHRLLIANFILSFPEKSCFFGYLFGFQGILSSVYLDGRPLQKWKMLPISLQNLNEAQRVNPIILNTTTNAFLRRSARKKLRNRKSKF